jgi:eukaryotic-like serine/threonine-protein kinase
MTEPERDELERRKSLAESGTDAGSASERSDVTHDPAVTKAPESTGGNVGGTPGGSSVGSKENVVSLSNESPSETLPTIHAESTGGPSGAQTGGPGGAPQAVPRAVAGYEILGVLGRGAMGVVYKARQPGLKRVVALKMILAGGHASSRDLARFRAEARAVAQLHHPNIVQLYEVGEDNGLPFFSLELVDGQGLDRKNAGSPMAPADAARLVMALAGAMDYAHRRQIIHRDLKPANVLMAVDGTPKISDFGLAKTLGDENGQTGTGSVLGTPSYMSPEQADGRNDRVGAVSDVYSLGAILYELLVGRAPFKAASTIDTLRQVRTQEPVAPQLLQPATPVDLETICLKCLQKEPAKRYESAAALGEDLSRFLAGEPIHARAVSRLERGWRWCKRNPVVAALSAAAVALLVLWALTSSALAWSIAVEQRQTEKARAEADENARLAEKNAQEARDLAVIAERNADKANKMATVAAKNELRARNTAEQAILRHNKAVEHMTNLVQQILARLRRLRTISPSAESAGQLGDDVTAMLRKSLVAMASDLEKNNISSFALASTYEKMGNLLRKLGLGEQALQQYQQGYDVVKQRVDQEPDDDQARANLGVMLNHLGAATLELNGDAKAARAYFVKAHDLQREIAENPKKGNFTDLKNKIILGHWTVQLGKATLALGDPPAAKRYFEEALALRKFWTAANPKSVEARSYVSEVEMWLGITATHMNDAKAAEKHFGECLAICLGFAKQFPKDTSFQWDLVDAYGAKCDSQLGFGQVAEAQASLDESQRRLDPLIERAIDDVSKVPLLAAALQRSAALARAQKKPDDAIRYTAEAAKLWAELVQVEPNNLNWQASYMMALARTGKMDEATKIATMLRERAPHSSELLLQVARCYAVCAASAANEKKSLVAKAIESLETAATAEFKDSFAIETDPDLQTLTGEPAYAAIIDRVRRR